MKFLIVEGGFFFRKVAFWAVLALALAACSTGKEEKDAGSLSDGYALAPIPFNQVNLEDNFWLPRLKTQAETLVPFALDKTRPAVENLEKAAKFLKGDTTDLPFPHRYISSDLYKVMEGAALLLMENPDTALEKRMDEIIDIIAEAQKEDGYLYVAHITGVSKDHDHWGGGGMGDKPYSFVVHSHELYNMGHMYEAAIAYYRATGKDKWLKVAEKNAQHINKVFFEGDPNYNNGKPVNQAPGHEELELALVKLYRVTGKELYLEMARKFLDIRGRTYVPEGEGVMAPTYAQQHRPVAEQEEAVGHAVRAAYLYSGMADVGAAAGTDEYNAALDKIWHNIVDTKMHITGGLGAVHGIEGFGPEYVLPNKEAYNETCAAVGNVFFNYRMFLLHKDARYMDVAEVALLNNALAGVNLEGNKFFYVNPLEADGVMPFNHGRPGRSPWFGTACCPSNIARLIPQVSGMMYAYTEEDIYVAFYAGSSTEIPLPGGTVGLSQSTGYPFDEYIQLTLNPEKAQTFSLKLRIPTWAGEQFVPGELYDYVQPASKQWSVKVNGAAQDVPLENGFASIRREWKPGDVVELHLPMPARFNRSLEAVEANRNRVAVTRGPLVYCAEEVDNAGKVQQFFLESFPGQQDIRTEAIDTGILQNVVRIELPARAKDERGVRAETLKLIPYYAWNNRGDASMIVWLPTRPEMVYSRVGDELRGGRFAGVKASSTSEYGSLEAIVDGRRPEGSEDRTLPSWISAEGGEQWVEIRLDGQKPIKSIGVYWFGASRKVGLPAQWSLEVKKNGRWEPFSLNESDAYRLDKDQYNVVRPSTPFSCDAVRINIAARPEMLVGILDVDIQYED